MKRNKWVFVLWCVMAGSVCAGEGYETRYEFMSFYCMDCHNAERDKGNVRLDQVGYGVIRRVDVPFWRSVFESMENHSMPPEDELQPEADEYQMMMGWMRRGLTNPREKRVGGLRLRVGSVYEKWVKAGLGVEVKIAKGSVIGRGQAKVEGVKGVVMNAQVMGAYQQMAGVVADAVIDKEGYSLAQDDGRDVRLFGEEVLGGEGEGAYIQQCVRRLMGAAYGREVSAEEAMGYGGIALGLRGAGETLEFSMNAALRLVLVSNEFVYVGLEVGAGR